MAATHTQFLAEYRTKLEELGFEGLTKADVKVLVDAFGDTVFDSLARQSKAKVERPVVVVKGVGRWTLTNRPARMGRNPATGEQIKIKAARVLKSSPDKAVADALKAKKRG
jgi:DNA-binding protein HU-beta